MNLKDDDPEAVEYLLLYLYTLQYPEIDAGDISIRANLNRLRMGFNLVILSDKFGVEELSIEARKEVCDASCLHLPTFDSWEEVDKASAVEWIGVCFTDATPSNNFVRSLIVKNLACHALCLLDRDDGKALIDTNTAFRHRLIRAMSYMIRKG